MPEIIETENAAETAEKAGKVAGGRVGNQVRAEREQPLCVAIRVQFWAVFLCF